MFYVPSDHIVILRGFHTKKLVLLFHVAQPFEIKVTIIARVAQWIEQLPSKEKVEGPIPSAGTIKNY